MSMTTEIWEAVKETASEWNRDNVSRLAAALSYYALLSIAPLLLVTVFVLGLVFGEESARGRVVQAMVSVVGPQGAAAIENLAKSAHYSGTGKLGSLIGVAIGLFGASGVFVELQAAFNTIWQAPNEVSAKRHTTLMDFAIHRFWSFVMVLGVSALLLVSAISSAVLAIVGKFFENALPGGGVVWQVVHVGLSLGIITLLFSVLFKTIPEALVKWSDVWLGGFVTALLFVTGNVLLGEYLRNSGVTSSFGGAGSVVALVVWVYYSAQIVFLGGEFAEVYSRRFGSKAPNRLIAL
jgi:membrane protein